MSDFLLIVPNGWTQLDWQYISNNVDGLNMQGVLLMINNSAYYEMEPRLKEHNLIPQDSTLAEAKLIDDTFFLIRLG